MRSHAHPPRPPLPLPPHSVLYGAMHVTSYDWLDADAAPSSAREARRVVDATLRPGDAPAVLFPAAGGNMHCFQALTDCAVLDVLSPPYATDEGAGAARWASLRPAGPLCAALAAACAVGRAAGGRPRRLCGPQCRGGGGGYSAVPLQLGRAPACTRCMPVLTCCAVLRCAGRDCTYYRECGGSFPGDPSVVLLEEYEPPEEFNICEAQLGGAGGEARAGRGAGGAAQAADGVGK
jgi:hypothetical protein